MIRNTRYTPTRTRSRTSDQKGNTMPVATRVLTLREHQVLYSVVHDVPASMHNGGKMDEVNKAHLHKLVAKQVSPSEYMEVFGKCTPATSVDAAATLEAVKPHLFRRAQLIVAAALSHWREQSSD